MMLTSLLLINKISFFLKKQKTRVLLLSSALFIICNYTIGQINYIPNPSFEKLDSLNDPVYFISLASPWDSLKNGGGGGNVIVSPTVNLGGTIFYQIARTGKYMAALTYYNLPANGAWRSYIQTPLLQGLKANKNYCVTGYFNLANKVKYAVDELSFYFDDGTITSNGYGQPAIITPQIKSPLGVFYSDTLNWMKVQGTFVATGSESYITIGNHKPTSSLTFSLVYPSEPLTSAGYFIDDVSVIEYDLPAYAGRDTVICTGDSVFIGRPPEIGLECLWFSGGTQIATGGGLWVKPATTQTFMVQQDVCGLIKTSTVSVQVKPPYTGTTQLTGNISTACLSDSVKLSVINPPGGVKVKYEWLPPGVFTSTTNLLATTFIKQNTTFTSNITSKGEDAFCPFAISNTVSVIVPDSCFRDPQIPNIFTPNNDGINDVWSIKFPYGFKMQTLTVYNRWGTLIYERNNLNFKLEKYAKIGWDGRTTSGEECSDGVYFYVLKYADRSGEEKSLKGNVTLIR